VAALAACSEGTPAARSTPSSPVPAPSASNDCPAAPSVPPIVWPPEVPADLPKPVGATIENVERTSSGVLVVRFTTPSSLRDGVLHVVRSFPQKGFTIGRGDAEVTEADAPFQRGALRGLVRLLAAEQCRTIWLLAIGTSGGAPFAPGYSPPPSSSPLPFG
jgi:hypothetical protein